jgi:hypothetical protein
MSSRPRKQWTGGEVVLAYFPSWRHNLPPPFNLSEARAVIPRARSARGISNLPGLLTASVHRTLGTNLPLSFSP